MLPESIFIKKLSRELSSRGGALYFVGGVVRDFFLQKETKDIDLVVTGINKDAFEKILSKHCKINHVGKSFGVYKCIKDNLDIDIAFPRKEMSTGDNHRDFEVESGPQITLEEDLFRRDFTLNSMAMDVKTGNLIDPYGGLNDLRKGLLKQLSEKSMQEDYLRALRAIQFVARFGFDIEDETLLSMNEHKGLLDTISSERVSIELKKFFQGVNFHKAIGYAESCGLLKEINAGLSASQWSKIAWLNRTEVFDPIIVFSMYFSMQNNQDLKDLLLSRKKNLHVTSVVANIEGNQSSETDVKLMMSSLEVDYEIYLRVKKYLDIIPDDKYQELHNMCQSIIETNQPYKLKQLAVDGTDLKEIGFSGIEIGVCLDKMLQDVIRNPQNNTKDFLLTPYLPFPQGKE